MLQKIRDKITGIVAIVFLVVIAIVFIFWGVDFQSGAVSYAAKVDGEPVPLETVRRAWQQRQSQLQQMLRDELPDELVQAQQRALLDQFVQQALLTQRAEEFGYHVSDEALVRRIMEIPQFQVDGSFNKDRYNALLRSSNLTEPRFESELRAEMLIGQLQEALNESAFVTPTELARRYALDKQAREVAYALVPAGQFAGKTEVTDEQIQKYYEDNRERFLLPESVDLQYVELTRAQAESSVSATEESLREYYEQVRDRFESPERRRARHILITTGEGVDEEAARKKAEELAKQAQEGADFAKLASEHSQDPGSAQQGGDLGWAQRGMFVGPFEEALFAMKANEIRGPVKTEFGYHVLKLEEVESGAVQSFEEARAEVEEEYRKDRAQTIFYDRSQELADLSFSTLTELESVAEKLELPLKTVKGFTREGGGELGPAPDVIKAAFSDDVLERRQNSPLVAVGEDQAIVLRVTEHTPAEPRPLAEVRDEIKEQLEIQAARDAAAAKGGEALARLEKGEAWAEVMSDLKLDAVGERFITRDDGVVPSEVAQAAFEAPSSEVSAESAHYRGVVTDDGNYAVLRVSAIRNAEPAAEPEAEKNARQRRLERQLASSEFAGYIAEAERNAEIEKNAKAFE